MRLFAKYCVKSPKGALNIIVDLESRKSFEKSSSRFQAVRTTVSLPPMMDSRRGSRNESERGISVTFLLDGKSFEGNRLKPFLAVRCRFAPSQTSIIRGGVVSFRFPCRLGAIGRPIFSTLPSDFLLSQLPCGLVHFNARRRFNHRSEQCAEQSKLRE